MEIRRRKGSTLGLVAACVIVVVVVGVGVFFLAKILGGGREVANVTDAGALNVAKQAITKARVQNEPAVFQDCEYPLGCGYINLLTYNRCVAKAILVASNAAKMSGPGTYKANALKVLDQLDQLGADLAVAIKNNSVTSFNDVSSKNFTNMFSLTGVSTNKQAEVAYVKPGGPTNLFFNTDVINGISIPLAPNFGYTSYGPKNSNSYVYAGKGSGYMAGYQPISILGRTIYGVPVFPQQSPHLIATADFNKSMQPIGSAPPNAVKVGSDVREMKTSLWSGAVAAAIVGAVEASGSGANGGTGGSLLGSGFQFPAAASYGYIEFGNFAANKEPPGYDPKDYQDNIFNQELATDIWATGEADQKSELVMFSREDGAVEAWTTWASKVKNGQIDKNDKGQMPTSTFYIGKKGADLKPALSKSNPPNASQLQYLQSMKTNVQNCYEQLSTNRIGFTGSCVAAIGSMEQTFAHPVPDLNQAGGSQNFSQADWAKAVVLVAFEGKGASEDTGKFNNEVKVNLNTTPVSGLGVFPNLAGQRVPDPPPNMQVPNPYQMPLQKPDTIYNLMCAVQEPGCLAACFADILQRAKQIQPRAGDAETNALLKSVPFPMGPKGNPATWDGANKLYLYLPNGDLSANLVLSATPPPKLTGSMPDGPPGGSNSCYSNKYHMDFSVVDSKFGDGSAMGDQGVHDAPYMEKESGEGLYAIDHADWTPGSGADNNFGRLEFREVGLGQQTFFHIN